MVLKYQLVLKKGAFMTDQTRLSRSEWLWPNCGMYLCNSFARFRYDFEQKELPSEAPFLITADQSYRLYVNGVYVCRGPARGYPDRMPFDRVDILRFLKTGKNWISVEAYNPGKSTFSYLHMDAAGMICAAKWDNGTEFHSTPSAWQIAHSPAHNPHTAHLSKQMAFQEDFDCSRDNRDWIFAEDGKLPEPSLQEKQKLSTPHGALPYTGLEERGIPMLHEQLCRQAGILCRGEGSAAPGFRETENIAWFFIEKEFPSMKWTPAEADAGDSQWLSCEIPSSAPDTLRSVTFDLGRDYLPGTLLLEVDGGSAGEILDVHYHQRLPNRVPEFIPPGMGSQIAMADRLRLAEGTCRHEFHHIMGVRQYTLLVRGNRRPLTIRTAWRSAVYPISVQGTFACSDPLLNKIREISRHTQQVCSLDAFVDTPWREQAQWWGDALVQAKNLHFLSADHRLLERGIRIIGAQENPYGLTFAHAPCARSCSTLPDFSLIWIISIHMLYFQTGSLSAFFEHHDKIKQILHYFRSRRTVDGLLEDDPRLWLFEDWGPLPKTHSPAFLLLLYLYALLHYEKLLNAAGLYGESASAAVEIAECRKLVLRRYYNPESGLLNATPGGPPIVHDQVLALLTGLPVDPGPLIETMIRPCLTGSLPTGTIQPSAYWSTFLLDAAQEYGMQEEALVYIRRNWEIMTADGTTWEMFGRDIGTYPGWSYSHAWSAHPLSHLPELLFGLRQTEPGWSGIRLEPFASGAVTSAEMRVPTPHGPIDGAWSRNAGTFSCTFRIPAGIRAEIRIPGETEVIRSGGEKDFVCSR